MTYEEYDIKSQEALKYIPLEFHSAFLYMAYDMGHAHGYYEVYGYLLDFIYNLEKPIQAYTNRLKNSG
jgi:hypothetical protein